jgi:DNA-binding response OmpR family regulator
MGASVNPKILLIEDDRELVESILLIFNYHWPEAQVIFSYSGEPGVELAKSENPDAVILDLGLPDISGFTVLRKIRLFSSVPIIVLTARSAEEDVVKALEEEATDYIIKPFRHREFLARIQSHISRWQINEIRAMTQGKIKA